MTKEEIARGVWKLRARPESSVIETTYGRLCAHLGIAAQCIEQVDGGYRARVVREDGSRR